MSVVQSVHKGMTFHVPGDLSGVCEKPRRIQCTAPLQCHKASGSRTFMGQSRCHRDTRFHIPGDLTRVCGNNNHNPGGSMPRIHVCVPLQCCATEPWIQPRVAMPQSGARILPGFHRKAKRRRNRRIHNDPCHGWVQPLLAWRRDPCFADVRQSAKASDHDFAGGFVSRSAFAFIIRLQMAGGCVRGWVGPTPTL